MSVYEHVRTFAGKRVVAWEQGQAIATPVRAGYRIAIDYDEEQKGVRWTDKFAAFLTDPAAGRVTGLVVGTWEEPFEAGGSPRIVEALVAARAQLPRLKALFLGDIISEESEISWIHQTDVTPLFDTYPTLEHFRVRGGTDLRLGPLRHARLKSLVVETGGLDAAVVRTVLTCELPALDHLELWLGDANYGANTTVADLEPLISGSVFPHLRYLGLRDSEIANDIAIALAQSPLLERIRVLDLSLGTLDDAGAAALLASPAVPRLEMLDLHHHYCSEPMVAQLKRLPIKVDARFREEPDVWNGEEHRYVDVSE